MWLTDTPPFWPMQLLGISQRPIFTSKGKLLELWLRSQFSPTILSVIVIRKHILGEHQNSTIQSIHSITQSIVSVVYSWCYPAKCVVIKFFEICFMNARLSSFHRTVCMGELRPGWWLQARCGKHSFCNHQPSQNSLSCTGWTDGRIVAVCARRPCPAHQRE